MVADMYKLAACHSKHWWRVFFRFVNIDDFQRPWTHKRDFFGDFFCNFWLQRTFQ